MKGQEENITWSTVPAQGTAFPPWILMSPWISTAYQWYSRQHTEPVLGGWREGNSLLVLQLTEPELEETSRGRVSSPSALQQACIHGSSCSIVKPTVCKFFPSGIHQELSKVKVKKFSKDSLGWIDLSTNAEFLL